MLESDSMILDKTRHVVSNDEYVRELSALSVLNVERMGCVREGKEVSTKATRGSTKGEEPCLERGKAWELGSSNKATRKQQTEVDCEVCSFEHIKCSFKHSVSSIL